jgi:hypothetical protein
MSRTMKDLAIEALAVQDACNLTGVVKGMDRALETLREILRSEGKQGNAHMNEHPISILWADKIASLTGCQQLGSDTVSAAYSWAYRMKDSAE